MIKKQFDSKFVCSGAFELGAEGYDGLDWYFRCAEHASKAMKCYSAYNLKLSIVHKLTSQDDLNPLEGHEW